MSTLTEGATPMPNSTVRLNKQEKKGRAEDDARTLANAKLIMGDANRLTEAKRVAQVMADKEREEASAMTDVSNLKTGSSLSPPSNTTNSKQKVKRKTPLKNPHNVFQKI